MNLIEDWNEFWFKQKSPGPLGLFRVLLGFIFIFWGILAAPPNLYTWFSERGVMPLSFADSYRGLTIEVNLLGGVTDPHILVLAWIALMVFAFLFAIGFFTKTSGLSLFLLFLSFNNRDPLILNSGDTLLRCTLFIMLLSPCGASCSVDRMIAIARKKEMGGDPAPVELWTQRLLQIQIALIYAATVASKLSGKDWLNGTAVYFPLHMDELTRFPLPSFVYDGWMINLMTWGTLFAEGSLATFIWSRRVRPYVLVLGICLHSGIEYALNIPLFSLIMISSYINFVYNEWIESWVSALARSFARYRLSVTLPSSDTSAEPWWQVVERLDILKLLLLDTSTFGELAVSGRGWSSTGPKAMRRIVLCLPQFWLFAPLLLIPGFENTLKRLLPKSPIDVPTADDLLNPV